METFTKCKTFHQLKIDTKKMGCCESEAAAESVLTGDNIQVARPIKKKDISTLIETIK